jgi:hypothetical protein
MKILTGMLMSALVAGVCLLGLSAFTGLYATAENSDRQPLNIALSDSPSSAWRLGGPVGFENLTLFPVLSDQRSATEDFITLDEGLKSGTVKVSELSGEPESSSSQIRQRGGAEVNRLAVTNNSGKVLILIAGEIVIGGKQDRIVGHDCAISSTNTPVPIDVFCVEHGRWSPRSTSERSASAGHPPNFQAAEGVMAAPKVREKAQASKDQQSVWNEVSDKVAANGVSTSTGTLNSVYEDRKVSQKLDAYQDALKGKLIGDNIVGVVVAVNGEIMSADVFANARLFQAYWPKMLKSFALEAISVKEKSRGVVTAREAQAFLSRASGGGSTTGKAGVYRLSENQSASDASFELESAGRKSALLHFNRVNKK